MTPSCSPSLLPSVCPWEFLLTPLILMAFLVSSPSVFPLFCSSVTVRQLSSTLPWPCAPVTIWLFLQLSPTCFVMSQLLFTFLLGTFTTLGSSVSILLSFTVLGFVTQLYRDNWFTTVWDSLRHVVISLSIRCSLVVISPFCHHLFNCLKLSFLVLSNC